MKILVTGAAGFIGSHVCERFIEAGHLVWGIDNLSRGLESNLKAIRNHPNFTFIHGDAGNIKLIEDFLIETILDRAFDSGRLARQAPATPIDLEKVTNYWYSKASTINK